MAPDPQRPIEKLLRQAAQERDKGAGGPFELHPATKQLLRGEVSRVYGKQAAPSQRNSWLSWFGWGRLAWSLGLLALLAFAVRMALPDKPGTFVHRGTNLTLAKSSDTPEAQPLSTNSSFGPEPGVGNLRQELALGAADKKGPATELAMKEEPLADTTTITSAPLASTRLELSTAPEKPAAPAPAPSARRSTAMAAMPTTAAPESSAGVAGGAPSEFYAMQPSAELARKRASTPQGAATASTVQPAEPRPAANLSDRVELSFSDLYRAPLGSVALSGAPAQVTRSFGGAIEATRQQAQPTRTRTLSGSSVLVSFSFEQTGSAVRLVDADGSVYSGTVQAGQRPASPDAARPTRDEAPSLQGRSSTPTHSLPEVLGYGFRVSGTNRTLNQPVIFTGTFLSVSNPPALSSGRVGKTSAQVSGGLTTTNTTGDRAGSPSRVFGRATVGSQELDVDAVVTP